MQPHGARILPYIYIYERLFKNQHIQNASLRICDVKIHLKHVKKHGNPAVTAWLLVHENHL